jgi:hypothetical protein
VSAPTLCIGLRFRRGFTADQWRRTLEGLLAWDPALRPTHVHRRDDPDASPDEPWSDVRWPELARRSAQRRSWSWGLENRSGSGTSLDIGSGLHQNDVLIAIDRPAGDLAERLLELLEAVRGGAEPALGLLYDCADGRQFVLQGLHRLAGVPPLLYLDATAVRRLGGMEHLRQAPCRRVETADGGLLLDVADPWRPQTPEDRGAAAAVERLLGIRPEAPLSLLDPRRFTGR